MLTVRFSDSGDDSDPPPSSNVDNSVQPTWVAPVPPTPTSPSYEYEYEEEDNSPPYRTFFIRRVRRPQIRAPLLFHFFSKGTLLYSAKTRKILTDLVFISESPSVHIKAQQYDWVLRVTKGQCAFELLKKDSDEIAMSLSMTNDYEKAIGPRKIEIDIAGVRLHSRLPVLKPNGTWCLPFSGKYVVPSQKNAVILDAEDQTVILVRKIEKISLELETIGNFSPLQMFVIGIASFICPI
jgi:hypothetical protein